MLPGTTGVVLFILARAGTFLIGVHDGLMAGHSLLLKVWGRKGKEYQVNEAQEGGCWLIFTALNLVEGRCHEKSGGSVLIVVVTVGHSQGISEDTRSRRRRRWLT